jgi:hypothetical protein
MGIVSVACQECTAFFANYRMATELFSKLSRELMSLTNLKDIAGPEFRRVKRETQNAREESVLAREALRVHQQDHNPKI